MSMNFLGTSIQAMVPQNGQLEGTPTTTEPTNLTIPAIVTDICAGKWSALADKLVKCAPSEEVNKAIGFAKSFAGKVKDVSVTSFLTVCSSLLSGDIDAEDSDDRK